MSCWRAWSRCSGIEWRCYASCRIADGPFGRAVARPSAPSGHPASLPSGASGPARHPPPPLASLAPSPLASLGLGGLAPRALQLSWQPWEGFQTFPRRASSGKARRRPARVGNVHLRSRFALSAPPATYHPARFARHRMMDSDVGWHPLTAFAERLHTSRRIAPVRPRAELASAFSTAAAAARSPRPDAVGERSTRGARRVRGGPEVPAGLRGRRAERSEAWVRGPSRHKRPMHCTSTHRTSSRRRTAFAARKRELRCPQVDRDFPRDDPRVGLREQPASPCRQTFVVW